MAAVQVNVTVLSITVNQIVGTFFFRFFFCVRFFLLRSSVLYGRVLCYYYFFCCFSFQTKWTFFVDFGACARSGNSFFFWVPPTVSILYDMEWMYWNGSVDSSMKLLWITMESL